MCDPTVALNSNKFYETFTKALLKNNIDSTKMIS